MSAERSDEERAAMIRLGQVVQQAGRLLEMVDEVDIAPALDLIRRADNALMQARLLVLPLDFA